jgi:hypothetical protein
MFGPLLMVQMWFCVAGARDSAPEPQHIIEKTVSRLSTFLRGCIYFLLTLSLLLSADSFFSLTLPALSIESEV